MFVARRKYAVWVGIIRLSILWFLPLFSVKADPTVAYVSLDFFEGGNVRPDDPKLERIFKMGQTRTVWTRLEVDNLRSGKGANPVEFRFLYYDPENNFLGEAEVEYTLPSGWEAAYLYAGWGWTAPGSWKAGIHRVEAYYYDPDEPTNDYQPGYTLFRTEFFSVERDPGSATLAPDPEFSLQQPRTFEGGRQAPSSRQYRETFPLSKSRSIWTEVNLINHRFGKAPLDYTIDLEYYGPRGNFLGAATIDWEAPKEWAKIRAVSGWGWEDTENSSWSPGRHRIKIKSGPFLLGETFFTMEDDRPVSLEYAARDLRLFEAEEGGKGAIRPSYGRVFSAESGARLQVEFTVMNPNFRVREHGMELRIVLSRVEGQSRTGLWEEEEAVAFEATTESRVLQLPLGDNSGERLGRGKYAVEVYLGERLLNLGYFRVEGPTPPGSLLERGDLAVDLPVRFKRLAFFGGNKIGSGTFEILP